MGIKLRGLKLIVTRNIEKAIWRLMNMRDVIKFMKEVIYPDELSWILLVTIIPPFFKLIRVGSYSWFKAFMPLAGVLSGIIIAIILLYISARG